MIQQGPRFILDRELANKAALKYLDDQAAIEVELLLAELTT